MNKINKLKDELSILKGDKSQIVMELRNLSNELKELNASIAKAKDELIDVTSEKSNETARLSDIQNRAFLLSEEMTNLSQRIKTLRKEEDDITIKKVQQERQHLRRLANVENIISDRKDEAEEVRKIFENNHNQFEIKRKELDKEIKDLLKTKQLLEKQLEKQEIKYKELVVKESVLTKERLKKESKIRNREKLLEKNEEAVKIHEDTLIAMQEDMMIVYGRLKELYAEVKPGVDLDKLITQVSKK